MIGKFIGFCTDAHARKLLGVKFLDDVAHAVVSACASFLAYAQFSDRQIYIVIANDKLPCLVHVVGAHQLFDRFARKIHIRLRFCNHKFHALVDRLASECVALGFGNLHFALFCQSVHRHKADVVICVFVLHAGVAQSYDEYHIVLLNIDILDAFIAIFMCFYAIFCTFLRVFLRVFFACFSTTFRRLFTARIVLCNRYFAYSRTLFRFVCRLSILFGFGVLPHSSDCKRAVLDVTRNRRARRDKRVIAHN